MDSRAAAAAAAGLETQDPSAAAAAFEAAVAPLELCAGDQLFGEGRVICRRAFEQDTEGFEAVVRKLVRRAHDLRNPLAVLITCCRGGDHVRAGRALRRNGDRFADFARYTRVDPPRPADPEAPRRRLWQQRAYEGCVRCSETKPIDHDGLCEICWEASK